MIGEKKRRRRRPVLIATVVLTLAVVQGCSEAADNDYKVTMTMTDPSGHERIIEIFIVDGKGVEVDDGRLESVIDLGEATWTEVESQRTVTLVECVAWVDEITQSNVERLSKAADSHNKFYRQRLLEPQFQTEEVGDLLVFKNDYFVYRISAAPDVSVEKAELYYEFDRLNANCGAMVRGDLPPNLQLAILDELKSRGVVPSSMYFERDFADEILSATISYEYRALTAEEKTQVAEWLTE